MNKYLIVWEDHSSKIIKGPNIGAAFIRNGYGAEDFKKIKNYYDLSKKQKKSFKKKLEELANT